jgi:ATP synthase protein I
MADRRPGGRSSAPQGVAAGGVMGVGLQFAASILLFLLAGHWLDGRLGSGPWLLLGGAMLGAAAGFYSMYRQLVVLPRRQREDGEER